MWGRNFYARSGEWLPKEKLGFGGLMARGSGKQKLKCPIQKVAMDIQKKGSNVYEIDENVCRERK